MIGNPVRQRIVNAALAALKANSHFHYAEIRPVPLGTFDELMRGNRVTVTTDCSGLATCCYHHAGAPDPNGAGYDTAKTMYTGTMLNTLPPIPLSSAHPGDLAVFGAFPGKHVVIIVGTGSDPQCVSHGGPGDPKQAPLSYFSSIGPLTVLRGVPRMATRRRVAKWRVTGDGGRVIGLVGHRSTRWIWERTHHGVLRKQHHQLHYDKPGAHAQASNPAADIAEQ